MNRSFVIDWIYDLPIQTLTDELKEDIVTLIIDYTQDKQESQKAVERYLLDLLKEKAGDQ